MTRGHMITTDTRRELLDLLTEVRRLTYGPLRDRIANALIDVGNAKAVRTTTTQGADHE